MSNGCSRAQAGHRVERFMLTLQPIFTSHNHRREGGRSTHIARDGQSLCGRVERGAGIAFLGDEIVGASAIESWMSGDADGELCRVCTGKAGALVRQAAAEAAVQERVC